MDLTEIRTLFPQLAASVNGRPLVYLDNAATSLRPFSVIQKWEEMSSVKNSNIHRAVHATAIAATDEFEGARKAVADFVGALPEEIVFTSGTTHSLNLLAFCLGESGFFSPGDEILIAESEHHSNIVPWQLLAQRKNLKINILHVSDEGAILLDTLRKALTEKTRLLCIAQISNVLGLINPIKDICDICHQNGTNVVVDGAQSVAHLPVDVREMDCDFFAFSGHKMYAAPGTGILYGKRSLLENLPPYMGGGEMIDSVSWEKTTFAGVPQRFEAGTQNFAGVPTFVPAIEMVKLLRNNEIEQEYNGILRYVQNALAEDPDIQLFGSQTDPATRIPLFSIAVRGAHHEDLALILDKMGIAVRSGQMCAEPLMTRFGVTGMLRASFAPYNTLAEAEYFIESLHKAIRMLK